MKNLCFSVIIILNPEILLLLYFYKMRSILLNLFFSTFQVFSFRYTLFHIQHVVHKSTVFVSWEVKNKREYTEDEYTQAIYTICLKANMFLDCTVGRRTETWLLGRFVGKMKGPCCYKRLMVIIPFSMHFIVSLCDRKHFCFISSAKHSTKHWRKKRDVIWIFHLHKSKCSCDNPCVFVVVW